VVCVVAEVAVVRVAVVAVCVVADVAVVRVVVVVFDVADEAVVNVSVADVMVDMVLWVVADVAVAVVTVVVVVVVDVVGTLTWQKYTRWELQSASFHWNAVSVARFFVARQVFCPSTELGSSFCQNWTFLLIDVPSTQLAEPCVHALEPPEVFAPSHEECIFKPDLACKRPKNMLSTSVLATAISPPTSAHLALACVNVLFVATYKKHELLNPIHMPPVGWMAQV